MRKWLSIALLLFSIAAPSATYSNEAPRNVEKTSASVETQKEDSVKLATRKRRCWAFLLLVLFTPAPVLIYEIIYGPATSTKWPVVVINYVAGFFLDLFCKYLLGMKVVDISGKDASWIQLLIRHIVKAPPLAFAPLFLFNGRDDKKQALSTTISHFQDLNLFIQAIIIFVREDRRSLSDLAAKTVVVMRDESTLA